MNDFILVNDDALRVLRKIPTESIDCIITDPPYRTKNRGLSYAGGGGMLKKDIFKKGLVFEHNNINIEGYASELFSVLKNKSHLYIMCNQLNLINMLNTLKNCGFYFIKCLIWDKGVKIMSQWYMSSFEYILFFRKGGAKKINNCGTSDIISIKSKKEKDENGENLHDTQKPIELMELLVNNSTNKKEIVLDPFMGIGTTGIAALKNDRKFIGIEIDKKYFEIAKSKIQYNG